MGAYHLALVSRKKKWVDITGKKWMVAVLDASKWKAIQVRRTICSSDVQVVQGCPSRCVSEVSLEVQKDGPQW